MLLNKFLVDMIVILGKGVIWRIEAFKEFIIKGCQDTDTWAVSKQNNNNLMALFTHMLTWDLTSFPRADIKGYVINFYFQPVEIFK